MSEAVKYKPPIFVVLGTHKFYSKATATRFFSGILHYYSFNLRKPIQGNSAIALHELIYYHHYKEQKIGKGIDYFFVDEAPSTGFCFYIKRKDGSEVDFSFIKCIRNYKNE